MNPQKNKTASRVEDSRQPAGSAKLKGFLERFFEDPDLKKKFTRVFYPFLGLLVILDLLVHKEHVTFLWDRIPGFWSVYGFIATVVMIVVSKAIGHAWLMKSEDYYD
jgi:hypothetical protein